jgi:hypothetical protein
VPSPTSRVLVSGSYDTTVRFWDLNTFRCMRKCDGHNDAVRVLAAYNGRVFSGSYDGTIGVSQQCCCWGSAAGVGHVQQLTGGWGAPRVGMHSQQLYQEVSLAFIL